MSAKDRIHELETALAMWKARAEKAELALAARNADVTRLATDYGRNTAGTLTQTAPFKWEYK